MKKAVVAGLLSVTSLLGVMSSANAEEVAPPNAVIQNQQPTEDQQILRDPVARKSMSHPATYYRKQYPYKTDLPKTIFYNKDGFAGTLYIDLDTAHFIDEEQEFWRVWYYGTVYKEY